MTSNLNVVLETVRQRLEVVEENPSDVEEVLSKYLDDIVQALVVQFDLSENTAAVFATDIIDTLAEEGEIPPVPGDGVPATQVAEWVGLLTTMGIEAFICELAVEEFAE